MVCMYFHVLYACKYSQITVKTHATYVTPLFTTKQTLSSIHTENSITNLIKFSQIWSVITLFQLYTYSCGVKSIEIVQ